MASFRKAQKVMGLVAVLVAACIGMLGQAGTAAAQASYTVLHTFTVSPRHPTGTLIRGRDGAFYGTTSGGGVFNRGTVFRLDPDGAGFTTLHSFFGSDGVPSAGLVQGSDGTLYGTTPSGGALGHGTIFKFAPDGTGFATLHSFTGSDGARPQAALVQGLDGALYGTTAVGGTNLQGSGSGGGTVFRLAPDGTGFTTLHAFVGSDGVFPSGALVQRTDGSLYGVTTGGCLDYLPVGGGGGGFGFGCMAFIHGTIFKLAPDGTGLTTLHSFTGPDGDYPEGGLFQGADGALYGTTAMGGTNLQGYPSGAGTVFKLAPDGTGFTTLHSFAGSDGASPQAALVQGPDGAFFGTTGSGGPSSYGTVFKLAPDGTDFATLHAFSGTDGGYPRDGLVLGTDGAFYGTTEYGGPSYSGTVFKFALDGTGFTNTFSFTGSEGVSPSGRLVLGTDGAYYGTTELGGSSNSGTVFKFSRDGTGFTTLHSFSGPDGAYPRGGLIQGADGALYGTTLSGGASGSGTVFKLAPDGTVFTLLHSFNGSDGYLPDAGLVQGTDGAFYGTTFAGGTADQGTVFKLAPDGTGFALLHSFTGPDGIHPSAAMVQGTDGALYGSTYEGGPWAFRGNFNGTVFKLNPDGTGFTILHAFTGADGGYPSAALVQGSDGAFYGTTQFGGHSGKGTIFKLSANGTGFTTLHAFSYYTDGAHPDVPLVQGRDGAFYGTTQYGGLSNHGTVFMLAADGTELVTLYYFGGFDGATPSIGLVPAGNGRIYGATREGGPGGAGLLFALQLSAAPTLALHVSQPAFDAGQNLTLTATVTPGSARVMVDVYVALQLPNGNLLFLQGANGFITAFQPFVANWPVGPFNGQVFSHTFSGGEPTGSYTWLAAFMQPGTLNLIGPIVSALFSFSP